MGVTACAASSLLHTAVAAPPVLPHTAPHCPTAACLLQAAQSRLDALEQDNPDDGGDPFGLLDDDDDEFVMQDSDQDGACLWTPSVALR